MQVLFDQGTPVPLRRYLALHAVATIFERKVNHVVAAINSVKPGDYIEVEF